MKLRRIIRRQVRSQDGSAVADVNAAIAVNAGEAGASHTSVSSHQRIVQTTRDGRTQTNISESSDRSPHEHPADPKESHDR